MRNNTKVPMLRLVLAGFLASQIIPSSKLVACTGCTPVSKSTKSASKDIDAVYEQAIDEIGQKYQDEIVPLLEANRKLHRKLTAGYKQLEYMERELMYVNLEIVKITEELKKIQALGEVKDDFGRDRQKVIKNKVTTKQNNKEKKENK